MSSSTARVTDRKENTVAEAFAEERARLIELPNDEFPVDRDQRIETEGHLQALVEEKRRAHQSRGFDRLFAAVPSSQTMMERIADRGANLGGATSGLLQLLERVGA